MSSRYKMMEGEKLAAGSSRSAFSKEVNPSIPNIHAEENQRYKMNHAEKSIALIFLNIHFDVDDLSTINGADNTQRAISETLESIGFEVRPYIDQTWKEIEKTLSEVAEEDHRNRDCLLVYIMTHGKESGKLYAKDKQYDVGQVWEMFNPEKAQSLSGKPKVLILDACRGTLSERHVEVTHSTDSPKGAHSKFTIPEKTNTGDLETRGGKTKNKCTEIDSIEPRRSTIPSRSFNLPCYADFLIVSSSMEGYCSFIEREGTWLVRAFCKELRENIYKMDFVTILTRTLKKVASRFCSESGWKLGQMPVFASTLTRDLYFYDKSQAVFTAEGILDSSKPPIRTEDLDRYKMNHAQKGIALIFNHIDFCGEPRYRIHDAERQQQLLSKTLTNIGFDVRLHVDLTWKEIENKLKEVTEEDHRNRDCLLIAIMTRGQKSGMLHAADTHYQAESVRDMFIAEKVPSLIGKPKIFLFQISRDFYSVPQAKLSDVPQHITTLPSNADFLIVFSYIKDSVWKMAADNCFIADLCEELRENIKKKTFLSILTSTSRRVAYSICDSSNDECDDGCSTVFTSTLTKDLYFYDMSE